MPPLYYTRQRILKGEPGIMQSVSVIRALARQESSHPKVRQATERLSLGTGPYDHAERLSRIRQFLLDHFQYHPDPLGTELVKSPAYLASQIDEDGLTLGDCDDAAALGSALTLSVGRPARLKVMSYRPDGALHHIYAEGHDGERWIELDPFRAETFSRPPTRAITVKV